LLRRLLQHNAPRIFQNPAQRRSKKPSYRELPIPGEDDFCLEYTWQLEGFSGFPGTDEDAPDPAAEEDLQNSLAATAREVEERGFDEEGTVVDVYRSTNPDWTLYEPTYEIPDFE
jgi:hypothetical protein